MEIKLMEREFSSPVAWGTEEHHKIDGKIKVSFNATWRDGFWFSVKCGNHSFGDRNPFKAFIRMIEAQAVGYGKYQQLKDLTRAQGLWKRLDPDFDVRKSRF